MRMEKGRGRKSELILIFHIKKSTRYFLKLMNKEQKFIHINKSYESDFGRSLKQK